MARKPDFVSMQEINNGANQPVQSDRPLDKTIGITHVSSCIIICRVPGKVFEHEADTPSAQTSPRDPASVNTKKQTCVIIIFAYFTLFHPNSH